MKPGIQEFRGQIAYLAGMTAGNDNKSSDEWSAVIARLKILTTMAKSQLKAACDAEREANEAQQKSGG